jgi:nitrate/TMAO reductase-like tetraheme cytochrome c subunit
MIRSSQLLMIIAVCVPTGVSAQEAQINAQHGTSNATAESSTTRTPRWTMPHWMSGTSGHVHPVQSSRSTETPRSLRMALRPTSADDRQGDDLLSDDLLSDALLSDDLMSDGLLSDDDPLASLGGIDKDPQLPIDSSIAAKDPHEELWTESCYPSAESCQKCHPTHYEEWRASSHAYAAVSPMYQRFEQAMTEYTRGTLGSFCNRCHLPVGTQLKLPRDSSVLDAPPVVREGVTCIACHRVNEHYWRSNGDRRIEPGDIHAPIGGSTAGHGLRDALSQAEELKLKPSSGITGPGQDIHAASFFYKPLTNSDVCVSCHQVAVHPGISLEVVHAQYRAGPAAAKGISCADCHMGAVPGKPDGYAWGHCATINDKPFGEPRKHANHNFWGPGYSIAHPGIFPHNPKAKQFAPRQWLEFDYQAGWGTEAFERTVAADVVFPAPWDSTDDRRDGRKIIDANVQRAQEKRGSAIMTVEAALKVDGPRFHHSPRAGSPLTVSYKVTNASEGHNLTTGSLGAQPQMWMNVVLIGPGGKRVWESGYLDRNADLADMNSVEVAEHRIPRDKDLFNLQTKFLINNIRGTDREVALPLNFSLDQLVFLRPGAVPVSVLNHPPLIRMEAHSIAPLDHRTPRYHIPASALRQRGTYRLSVRMRSRTEPMYFMRQINCTPDMIRRMNENMLDLCTSSHTFMVK